MRRKSWIQQGLLTALVVALGGPSALPAQSEVTTYTPSRIAWSELKYAGGKFGIKARSEIEIDMLSADQAQEHLIDAGEREAVVPGSDPVALVKIFSEVKGTENISELLLNADNAAAYQRAQVSTSKKRSFRRVYRYLPDGVFIQRQMPGRPTGDPADWPVSNSRVIEFPSGVRVEGATEGMALFYMLSAADFRDVGDTLRFFNFDRDGMTEVVMTIENLEPRKVDYMEISSSGQRRVKETRTVAVLTVSGSSVGGGEDSFEFLGLRGKIEIFADTELRIPVAVRGKVPIAGRLTVEVQEVVLR